MKKRTIIIASISLLLFGCIGQKEKKVYPTNSTAEKSSIESVATVSPETGTEDNNDSMIITITPCLKNDTPVIMNDRMSIGWSSPQWDPRDIWDENGVMCYNINMEADGRFIQTLHEDLPGIPIIREEVGRLVLLDINNDNSSDLLICLGRYGEKKELFFDAWIWKYGQGKFIFVDGFRSIPSPSFNTKSKHIISGDKEWVISKEKLKNI